MENELLQSDLYTINENQLRATTVDGIEIPIQANATYDLQTGEFVQVPTKQDIENLMFQLQEIRDNTVPVVVEPSPVSFTAEQGQQLIDSVDSLGTGLSFLMAVAGAFVVWKVIKAVYSLIGGTILGGV